MAGVLGAVARDIRTFKEIRPIVAIVSFACTMGVAASMRTLFTGKDVVLDHKTNPSPWEAHASDDMKRLKAEMMTK